MILKDKFVFMNRWYGKDSYNIECRLEEGSTFFLFCLQLDKISLMKTMAFFFSIPDKGEVAEAEGAVQEEDILMQDEIFKSRLASIKRVS